GLCGEGGDRVHRLLAQAADGAPERPRPRRLAVRRRGGPRRGPVRGAAARRRGRVRRLDPRGPAARLLVQGTAPRQGPGPGRAGGGRAVSPATRPLEVKVANRTLRLTNLDKVYWPDYGFTKGQMIDYYTR